MPLSREAVEQFQQAYEEEFQEPISFENARAMFAELILFFRELLTEPLVDSQDLSTGDAVDFMEPKRD